MIQINVFILFHLSAGFAILNSKEINIVDLEMSLYLDDNIEPYIH